jgi:hypothetical protein
MKLQQKIRPQRTRETSTVPATDVTEAMAQVFGTANLDTSTTSETSDEDEVSSTSSSEDSDQETAPPSRRQRSNIPRANKLSNTAFSATDIRAYLRQQLMSQG